MSEIYNLPEIEKGVSEDDVRRIVNESLSSFDVKSNLVRGHLQSNNFVTGVSGWQITNDNAEFRSITIGGYIETGGALADVGVGNITGTYIHDGAVTTDKIYANAVVAGKINVDNLSSIKSDLGDIDAGTITLNSAGHIKGGQTAYNTGTGYWLGYDSAYKFSIGDGTKKFTWDGSALTVTGGTIVSGLIQSTANGNDRVEINATGTYSDRIVFYKSSVAVASIFGVEAGTPDGLAIYGIAANPVGIGNATNGVSLLCDGLSTQSKTFVPSTTSTYYLGASNLRWLNIYGVSGNFSGNMTIGGTLTGVTSLTLSGAISGGTTISCSGNITTSTGDITATAGDIKIGGTGHFLDCDDGYVKNSRALYLNPVSSVGATEGGIYYDSDDNHFKGYDGKNWLQLDN